MITFLKVQAASIIGSFADYFTTIIFVELFHSWYVFANLIGNLVGGTVQFKLSRNWVFKTNEDKTGILAVRFVIFFLGNLFLSAAGIYFFTHNLGINYLISKTIVSVLLGVSYNYFVQKKFVFK